MFSPVEDILSDLRDGKMVVVTDDELYDEFHGRRLLHGATIGAIEAFLAENPGFVADRSRERFLFTMQPKGYLKRVR